MDGDIKWIDAAKLYTSKRRFCMRCTFAEFVDLLKSDPVRIETRQYDDVLWVRAL